MFTQIAKSAAIFSLMLSASVAAPAFSAGKHDKANCPYAKAKVEKTKRIVVAPLPQGIMLVEHRKRDVQILSFGP